MDDDKAQKFILGLGFVMILVKILKKFFKAPRPNMTDGSTYGLPSTRAASLFYIVIFLILNNKLSKKTIITLFVTIIVCCLIKYYMKEHSIKQLTIGALLGTSIAYLLSKKSK